MEETTRAKRKPRRCPRCGSARVAAILWGLPAGSPALDRDLEAGRVVLGGCCVGDDDPAWECADCGAGIHREAPYSARDKFDQPLDAIHIVHRAEEPRTSLTPEAIERGRARVAAGEDVKKVSMDLAIEEVANLEGPGPGPRKKRQS